MSINHNHSVKESEQKQNKKYAKSFLGFLILPVMLVLLFMFAGCSGDGQNSILGKWVDSSGDYVEFFSDGTYILNGSVVEDSGTFVLDGNRIKLNSSRTQPVVYTVSLSDQSLELVSDNGSVFIFFRPDNAVIVSQENKKTDAATIDAACKDYYAEIVAGLINDAAPGKVTTATEMANLPKARDGIRARKTAALKCTIQGAMEYAGVEYLSNKLGDMTYDSEGTIFAKDDKSRTPKYNAVALSPTTTFSDLGYT